ncbi:hypothetical protein AAULR_22874 [Lacticaseibacillus rhamnosus MTCC 5462]|nr:hypothetical protein AAULR_22874 [Lacticaseibacillus rhamnosus MTCC 5462]
MVQAKEGACADGGAWASWVPFDIEAFRLVAVK